MGIRLVMCQECLQMMNDRLALLMSLGFPQRAAEQHAIGELLKVLTKCPSCNWEEIPQKET